MTTLTDLKAFDANVASDPSALTYDRAHREISNGTPCTCERKLAERMGSLSPAPYVGALLSPEDFDPDCELHFPWVREDDTSRLDAMRTWLAGYQIGYGTATGSFESLSPADVHAIQSVLSWALDEAHAAVDPGWLEDRTEVSAEDLRVASQRLAQLQQPAEVETLQGLGFEVVAAPAAAAPERVDVVFTDPSSGRTRRISQPLVSIVERSVENARAYVEGQYGTEAATTVRVQEAGKFGVAPKSLPEIPLASLVLPADDDPDDTYGEQRERFGTWVDDEEEDGDMDLDEPEVDIVVSAGHACYGEEREGLVTVVWNPNDEEVSALLDAAEEAGIDRDRAAANMVEAAGVEAPEDVDLSWETLYRLRGSRDEVLDWLIILVREVEDGPEGGDDETFDYWPSGVRLALAVADKVDERTAAALRQQIRSALRAREYTPDEVNLFGWVDDLPAAGTRVVLLRDVDRYPHFTAPKGSTGTVVDTGDPDMYAVRIDGPALPGAETWDNEVHWSLDAGDDPLSAVAVLAPEEPSEPAPAVVRRFVEEQDALAADGEAYVDAPVRDALRAILRAHEPGRFGVYPFDSAEGDTPWCVVDDAQVGADGERLIIGQYETHAAAEAVVEALERAYFPPSS